MLITDKIQLLKHLQGLLRNIGGRPEQISPVDNGLLAQRLGQFLISVYQPASSRIKLFQLCALFISLSPGI